MAVFVHLNGSTDYREVHALQQQLVEARARGEVPDVVLLLEHAEVITLGRAKGAERSVVDAGDVPVVRVERGGDATWHGPGQLVAYPIVKLEGARADLHLHLRSLEDAVIGLLGERGVHGGRDPRNTGVWVGGRKICSIGVACRRWVTWHGLALNVGVDLERFRRIRPCGFEPDVMTTLAEVVDPAPALPALVEPLARWLGRTLEVPVDALVAAEVGEVVPRLSGLPGGQ